MNQSNPNSQIKVNLHFNELNRKIQTYIQDIIKLLDYHLRLANVRSIILFGSQVRNSSVAVSDCDLLIIVENNSPKSVIYQLKKALLSLEIKYNFVDYSTTFFNSILFAIQRTTGMFVSHFITEEENFLQARFSKIFNVNPMLSKLLAPEKLVLLTMLENSTLIYGGDLRDGVSKMLEGSSLTLTIIKSLFLNIIISLFSILLIPFNQLSPIKYTLEAIKWSLKSVNYYIFHTSNSLNEIITKIKSLKTFPSNRAPQDRFYKHFLYLRHHPKIDPCFMVRSPLKILNLHLYALKLAPTTP